MHPVLHSIWLSFLPCLIPPYAFRLARLFGTQRVGWLLFGVFSCLATLELLCAWHPFSLGLDPARTLDLLNFIIPLLLLIGMAHIESLFKARLRLEMQERKLRDTLELEVRERTADLDRANEELQREISLRKQGEQELLKSKEQYRFLFDENPQPMWIFDLRSSAFLAFNSAALRHYGYSTAQFRSITARDFCRPEDLDIFLADCAKPSPTVQPRGLWRHRKKDGSLIEVELTVLDLHYAECPARLVLATDVSAQRLLQKQLLQSQRLTVTTQLAGGVADNFNRLITGIEGDAAVLVKKCQDPVLAEPLRRIAATAGSATALNRQLLALVRRHPMQAQSVDLNQLLESQSGLLDRLLGPKITRQNLLDPNLPPIPADPNLVERVLHILVLNARDAMPDGGALTLSTAAVRVDEAYAARQEDARPGIYVCLTVSDTGCGMTPEVQARLFEPFFTTKDPAKATGLGLATAHGLVKQHAGWFQVASHPGFGSQLAVFWPSAPA